MENEEKELGIGVKNFSYALSVGACVGGIGSIMGSSANLVAMGISARYLKKDAPEDYDELLSLSFSCFTVLFTYGH